VTDELHILFHFNVDHYLYLGQNYCLKSCLFVCLLLPYHHINSTFTCHSRSLYLMHKKWNSYVYLEPDTTIGNFEVRITTFMLTACPLQFTEPSEFVLSTLTQNVYLPI